MSVLQDDPLIDEENLEEGEVDEGHENGDGS
jgi:hypothetical protein